MSLSPKGAGMAASKMSSQRPFGLSHSMFSRPHAGLPAVAGMLVWCRAGSPRPAELPGRFKLSSGGGCASTGSASRVKSRENPRPTFANLYAGCQHKGGFGLFYLLGGGWNPRPTKTHLADVERSAKNAPRGFVLSRGGFGPSSSPGLPFNIRVIHLGGRPQVVAPAKETRSGFYY